MIYTEYKQHGSPHDFKNISALEILNAIAAGNNIDLMYVNVIGDFNINIIRDKLEQTSQILNNDSIPRATHYVKSRISMQQCKFNVLSLSYAVFEKPLWLTDSIVTHFFYIVGSDFLNDFHCDRGTFGNFVSIHNTHFLGNATFLLTHFTGQIILSSSFGGLQFSGGVNFHHIKTTGSIELDAKQLQFNYQLEEARGCHNLGHAFLLNGSTEAAAKAFYRSGMAYFNAGYHRYASQNFAQALTAFKSYNDMELQSQTYILMMESMRKSLTQRDIEIPEQANLFYRMRYPQKHYQLSCRWLWLSFLKISSCYGESPGRFALFMTLVILFFSLLYTPAFNSLLPESCRIHLPSGTYNPDSPFSNIVTAIYFSVVTFVTLGFGDIYPISDLGKIVVITEVLAGYLMLGALVTLVLRKFIFK